MSRILPTLVCAAALGCAVLAASVFAMCQLHGGPANPARAVVIAENAQARFAPADDGKVVLPLPAGSEVHILSERGAWSYVLLPDRGRGWLASEKIERLRMNPPRRA